MSDAPRLLVLVGVFFGLLAAWCLIAYRIHDHELVAPALKAYGHKLVPFILIGLGIYILFT